MRYAKSSAEIGKLIMYFRELRKLSQSQLAKKSKLTQVSISNIENGIGGSMKSLEKILRALELEISFRPITKIDTSKLLEYVE